MVYVLIAPPVGVYYNSIIKLEDVVDLPAEPYHPQRIQQFTVQCKAQKCYDSQSRQLKNEGDNNFSALCVDGSPLRASTHYLRQWPYHALKKMLPTGLV